MAITIYDLFAAGWTAHKVSLYDEEGVEGWRWEDAAGNERDAVMGDWNEPPPLPEATDDELRAAITTTTNESEQL